MKARFAIGLGLCGLFALGPRSARADNPDGPSIVNHDAQTRVVILTADKAKPRRIKLKPGHHVQLNCKTVSLGDQTVQVDDESQYTIEDAAIHAHVIPY
jgi:hypothetical protein